MNYLKRVKRGSRWSRRDFLKTTIQFAGAATIAPVAAWAAAATEEVSKRVGPNDRLHVAVMGVHGQGRSHVRQLLRQDDVEITAICDPDPTVGEKAVKTVEEKTGKKPAFEKDIRKVLEDKSLNAITIATPNHWHSLAAIWAVQAGKDVYVEKPVSHNVSEGRRLVEAAGKYGRIVQTGTQSRTQKATREAIEFLHAEKLGKIRTAYALCYKRRKSIGKVQGKGEVPPGVDYNLWLGPAPKKPVGRKRFHYDWHWFFDYGNGDLGNQGIHQMDIARWGLNKPELAQSVISIGGRLGYEDDANTPNSLVTALDYGDRQLIFEVRGLESEKFHRTKVGNVFACENGYVVWYGYGNVVAYDLKGNEVKKFSGGGDHMRNFLDAARSRDRSTLNAEILEGHLSSALCHLGNISYQLGTPKRFKAAAKPFGDDPDTKDACERLQAHLTDNGVDLRTTRITLGKRLAIDPISETFKGSRQANALLTREYRKPFVVPEKV